MVANDHIDLSNHTGSCDLETHSKTTIRPSLEGLIPTGMHDMMWQL